MKVDQIIILAAGAASAQTTATFSKGARIQLVASTNAWVQVGSNPTAAAGAGLFLGAGIPQTIVIGDSASKIAAIQATAAGSVCIAVL